LTIVFGESLFWRFYTLQHLQSVQGGRAVEHFESKSVSETQWTLHCFGQELFSDRKWLILRDVGADKNFQKKLNILQKGGLSERSILFFVSSKQIPVALQTFLKSYKGTILALPKDALNKNELDIFCRHLIAQLGLVVHKNHVQVIRERYNFSSLFALYNDLKNLALVYPGTALTSQCIADLTPLYEASLFDLETHVLQNNLDALQKKFCQLQAQNISPLSVAAFLARIFKNVLRLKLGANFQTLGCPMWKRTSYDACARRHPMDFFVRSVQICQGMDMLIKGGSRIDPYLVLSCMIDQAYRTKDAGVKLATKYS
jgi:DNA polymerase III delta subunit